MARRPHGVVYGLLATSLAVNLVGTGYLGYLELRPKPPRSVETTIDFVAHRYPSGVGTAVRARLKERRADLQRAFDEMKAARRATRDAMAAQPFDPARVEAAFAESRAKSADFQKVIHGAIIAALPNLAETDRAKIGKNAAD
jgi:uncharacterized membrane protein